MALQSVSRPHEKQKMTRAKIKDGKLAITEKAFQAQVIELAHWHKWRVAHFRPARALCPHCKGVQGLVCRICAKDGKGSICRVCRGSGYTWRTAVEGDGEGFPDLILIKQFSETSIIIAAELKSQKGKLSDNQRRWIASFNSVPGAIGVTWRPDDYDDVQLLLSGLPDIILEWTKRV
ncbi:MAG TPA: VRR-NUC domain-containing protein [Thermoguttaceae bacterium]